MDKIQKIYSVLHKKYGPQGWWPTAGKYSAGNWKKKKTEKEIIEIIFGAILTQNTSWNNVEKALCNLEKEELISLGRIKRIKKQKLATLIRSAGYFNQKTERLQIVSDFLQKNNIKRLKSMKTEELRETLLAVKGIGPETADSIILYALDKPIFVIDAYTRRIISRVGLCGKDIKYDELQKIFHKNLKPDLRTYNEYHALLVELAKRHCRTKQVCEGCPLSRMCEKRI